MSLGKFAKDPVSRGAARSLSERFEAVEHWLPLAAQQPEHDVEYVHQLRVCTRKAGAALKLFSELLPKKRAKKWKQLLKRIRTAAGDARDDDVQLARLTTLAANEPVLDPLVQQVREHRAASQAQLVELWRATAGHLKASKLLNRVAWRAKGREPSFHVAAVGWLKTIIEEFWNRQPAAGAKTEELHAFRIAAKQLRYALDLLTPALPGPLANRATKRLSKLQDRLGAVNDHATSIDRLESWSSKNRDEDLKAALATQLNTEREALANCRESFTNWWTVKEVRSLQKRLDGLLD